MKEKYKITMKLKERVLFEKEVKTRTILATMFVVDCVAGAVLIKTLK